MAKDTSGAVSWGGIILNVGFGWFYNNESFPDSCQFAEKLKMPDLDAF